MLSIWLLSPASAQEQAVVDEYLIKAAFLYKFIDYVEWPPQAFTAPDAPLVIGIFDAEAVADILMAEVAKKKTAGRPVIVRRLTRADTVDGAHVIFIGRAAKARLDEFLNMAREKPILTITEVPDGLDKGSMINFVMVDDKVRFDIAPPPTDSRSIKVSARLLSVARKVIVRPS